MFSLALLPLLGALGLVVDVGWAYYRRQAAQTAADAAAAAAAAAAYDSAGGAPACSSPHVKCYAAEYTCPATPSTSPADNIGTGCLYAKENGFVSSGRQKVTFQSGVGASPVATGVTVAYWVSARVTETIPQLFSAVLGHPEATVSVRATTGTREASSGGCVVTLNPQDPSLSLSGKASLTTGCGVFVNSNNAAAVNTNGNGTITTTGTAKTQIVGNCTGCDGIHPTAQVGVTKMTDPFADMNPPTYGNCSAKTVDSKGTTTLDPGRYCAPWILGAQAKLTLKPGVYTLDVDTTFAIDMAGQAQLSGSGVTIYLKRGGVNMSGGSTVSLSAPSSGDWQGILFFEDRNNSSAATLVGGTGQLMNGVLYFPKGALTYTGGSSTNATATTIVSDTLSLVGDSHILASASTNFTGVTGGVFLVE